MCWPLIFVSQARRSLYVRHKDVHVDVGVGWQRSLTLAHLCLSVARGRIPTSLLPAHRSHEAKVSEWREKRAKDEAERQKRLQQEPQQEQAQQGTSPFAYDFTCDPLIFLYQQNKVTVAELQKKPDDCFFVRAERGSMLLFANLHGRI